MEFTFGKASVLRKKNTVATGKDDLAVSSENY